MKLHLPVCLLFALLSSYANANSSSYTNTTEQYVYSSDVTYTPDNTPEWTGESPLLTDANLNLSSSPETPVSLTFQGGSSLVADSMEALTFDTFSKLTFSSNTAGACSLIPNGTLTISNVSDSDTDTNDVIFCDNQTTEYGAAVRVIDGSDFYGVVTISNNGGVNFSQNSSTSGYGGAIYAPTVYLSSNEGVCLSYNSAVDGAYGGAIYGLYRVEICCNSGYVDIHDNNAYATLSGLEAVGGAIHTTNLLLNGNNSVLFSDNKAEAEWCALGGALYADGELQINSNYYVQFAGNEVISTGAEYQASACGGAIFYSFDNLINIDYNNEVYINHNAATAVNDACGGAIYGSCIIANNNGTVQIFGNEVTVTGDNCAYSNGGAIYAPSLYITGNWDTIYLTNNTATGGNASGGAINFTQELSIENNTGEIIVRENAALGIPIAGTANEGRGGAIFSDADMTLKYNSAITFEANRAEAVTDAGVDEYGNSVIYAAAAQGGAISAGLTAEGNGSIIFEENNSSGAHVEGGALYGGTVSFTENEYVLFDSNTATIVYNTDKESADALHYSGMGGAVRAYEEARFENNTEIVFTNNKIEGGNYGIGGAVMCEDDGVIFDGNGSILFENNQIETASMAMGGAIGTMSYYSISPASPLYIGNVSITTTQDTVSFSGNTVSISGEGYDVEPLYTRGGAIFGNDALLKDNNEVYFTNNAAINGYGGAIYSYGNTSIQNNSYVSFYGNSAYYHGGAIYNAGDCFELRGNTTVEFEENGAEQGGSVYSAGKVNIVGNYNVSFASGYAGSSYVSAYGGAIASEQQLSISHNKNVAFVGNYSGSGGDFAYGGAIYAKGDILINDNERINFSGNKTASGQWRLDTSEGGAIYAEENISFVRNSEISFSENSAEAICPYYEGSANGGAIYAKGDLSIADNDKVMFYENKSQADQGFKGGVIYAESDIIITNNEDVSFRDNMIISYWKLYGAAIFMESGMLKIEGNKSVVFEKNCEYIPYGEYILRGAYQEAGSLYLSAEYGHQIVFNEALYSGATDISFNHSYLDSNGELQVAQGDIVFSGQNTASHLAEIKNGTAGTESEILASRTSEVAGMTNLHGGRLCIEDGAIYKGQGITVHEGTGASVRLQNGIMNHEGYTLTFNWNTALELTGNNTISAERLYFKSGSNMLFDLDFTPLSGTILTYSGDISMEDKLEIKITGYDVLEHEGTVLLIDFTNPAVDLSVNNFEYKGYGQLYYNEDEQNLYFVQADKNVWVGGKKAAWTTGSGSGWQDDLIFRTGNRAVFNTSGTVSIVGEVEPSAILVDIEKNLTFKTSYDKKTGTYTGAIVGDGILVKRGNGTLTLNDGNAYRGATYIEAGTVKAGGATSFGKVGAIYLSGGTLDLASKEVGSNVVQKGDATVKNGGKFTGYYSLEYGELQKGSLINLVGSSSLQSGTINGTLSGKGTAYVYGDVLLGTDGKITTGGLYINGSLKVSSKGMTMDTKSSAISIYEGELSSEGKISAYSLWASKGSISVSNATPMAVNLNGAAVLENETQANIYGAFSAASLELTDSTFTMDMADEFVTVKNAPKAQSISLKDKYADNLISNSVMNIGGKMSVAGNLTINAGSELHFYDPGTKNKAQSLAVKGSLNFGGGSSLYLNGSLSAKDLTLGSGTLTLNGAKLSTVKVGNSLTLEGGTTLNLGFSVNAKDEGKNFKIFTFKTIAADITDAALNELLGLGTDVATLAFDTKRKAITLTVTDAEAWNEYAESVRNGSWGATPSEDDELVESAGAFVLARPAAAGIDPMLGKVADTLVQSTWGTAGASRAFGDTIAARGAHATALADGKGAAWISTMGGSSRISSDGAHAGADYTLTGAAFGMEARLSEKSTVGLAIGNSWGKVSTFSAFPVDQDSTHQGIYGKHLLGSSTTLSWMAAHTRAESDANLAGMACDWTQDALQLDARVDKLFAISDRTTVSAFVGMQYLATDKGECDGLSTGSLQNLRGEIGVSAAHKATDKAYIYGELSFIGDMVRHNPTATVGDYRSRGANPGRAGLNLSVGASYQLNDSWSLNGSYSLELMQNQTSHSANVGATYSF